MVFQKVINGLQAMKISKKPSPTEAGPSATPPPLPVGPLRDEFLSLSFSKGSVIGRVANPDLSSTVESRHALFDSAGNLRDLGSKHGTFVNGKLLIEPQPLKPGDVIRLGKDPTHYVYDGESLRANPVVIGRSSSADIRPEDGSLRRKHALLTAKGELKPLKEEAKVFVDGKALNGPQQLTNGNVVTMGEWGLTNFYYHHGKLHSISAEKAHLLRQLFPQGLPNTNFDQGAIGNCTFLASLKSVLQHNPAQVIHLLKPVQDRSGLKSHAVEITFPERKPIYMRLDDYKKQGVKGALGVRLLETAFGRHIKEYEEMCTIRRLNEGGYSDLAIQALSSGEMPDMILNSGRPLGADDKIKAQCLRLLKVIQKDPINRFAVASAGFENKALGIIPNHCYAILGVDAEKQIIQLANPHATAKPLDLSFESFFRYFRRLTVAKPASEKSLKEPVDPLLAAIQELQRRSKKKA